MNRDRRHPHRIATSVATVLLSLLCANAFAQAPAAAPAPAKPTFKEEELAALLAPIALYPDTVVAQMLMASTYPLEVVSANRWLQKNPGLKGEALAKEAKKQPWAESVQAMTALPEQLKQMDEKLEWTQKLGDAYLAQPKDVMAMVQVLRSKAKTEGNLKSDEKMKVSVDQTPADASATSAQSTTTVVTPPTQTIIIESSDPQVVYVPAYNPTVIYGSWGYPAYPPYYWPPPYGYPAYGYGAGFFWGAAVGISIGYWGGGWNNSCNWHGGDININGDVNIGSGNRNQINGGNRNQGGNNFQHDPSHRQGVSYRDQGTANKYNKGGTASASNRDAARSKAGGATAATRDMGGAGSGTRDLGGASAGTRDLSGGSGAGVRDLGGSGASAGTRDLGSSGGGASAGTRDVGSSSRGGSSSGASSRGSSYSGGNSAFSGSSSGRSASSYGSRGGASRGGGGGGRRR